MFRRLAMILSLVAAVAAGAAAQAETWQIDSAHSAAEFAVRHMAIATVHGRFNRMSGKVFYDPADPSKTAIDATIDAATIDTHIEVRDKDLRSPRYFDVEHFPTLTFRSKKVELQGAGKLKIVGDLTMHGVTREVVLDVDSLSGPATDPHGSQRLGATATTRLNRRDFGVNGGAGMVSDEVVITLDLELVK